MNKHKIKEQDEPLSYSEAMRNFELAQEGKFIHNREKDPKLSSKQEYSKTPFFLFFLPIIIVCITFFHIISIELGIALLVLLYPALVLSALLIFNYKKWVNYFFFAELLIFAFFIITMLAGLSRIAAHGRPFRPRRWFSWKSREAETVRGKEWK